MVARRGPFGAHVPVAILVVVMLAVHPAATDARQCIVMPAPVPEPVPVAPTFEQLVAQASTFAELKALVASNLA
jgi:hypothetical protein